MAAMRKDIGTRPAHVTTLFIGQPPQHQTRVLKPATINSIVETATPETPQPDYDDDNSTSSASNKRNSCKFVNNFQNVISNIRNIELSSGNLPEPDPDYLNDDEDDAVGSRNGDFPPPPPPLTAEELASAVSEAYESQVQNGISPTADGREGTSNSSEQIKAKPLQNPCVDSKERQALHKELLLNYKIGKDVLQKPELNKVLRERRETQRKKEWEEQKSTKGRTSLELKLQERRVKEEENLKLNMIKEDGKETPELLRIHKKITHKTADDS